MEDRVEIMIYQYYEVWRETNALYVDWAKERQISYFELLVILSLSQTEEPYTQKRICEQWTLPKQTANSILQNYLKQGWVCFEPLKDDKRNKRIKVTQAGKAYFQQIAGELLEHEKRVWERLGIERGLDLIENTILYNKYFKEAIDHGAT